RVQSNTPRHARLHQLMAHPLRDIRVRRCQLDEPPDEPFLIRHVDAELMHRFSNDLRNALFLQRLECDVFAEVEEGRVWVAQVSEQGAAPGKHESTEALV